MTIETALDVPPDQRRTAALEHDEDDAAGPSTSKASGIEHATLKYSLLGPSLTKAGQDSVDQSKVRLDDCVLVMLRVAKVPG